MKQSQQVILSIKRRVDTIDGQVISYLKTEPFGLGDLPQIVMLTPPTILVAFHHLC
jgi:hypothetical protein